MTFRIRSVLAKSLVLSILLAPGATFGRAAAQIDPAAVDFSPLSGVVIMPVEDEYLIDLDASRGVIKGDLFTAVQPGPKIIHPETGEMLGTLDRVKAVLEVTRIKSGYSLVRPLEEGAEVKAGDKVRRYGGVPAAFWDYTDRGKDVFKRLRTALPELDWTEYAAAQAERPERADMTSADRPPLVFVLTERGVAAQGASGQVLHAYYLAEDALDEMPAAAAPKPNAVPAPATTPTPRPSALSETTDLPPESSAILRSKQAAAAEDVWYGPQFDERPVGIATADVDGDGANELAVLYKKRLDLMRLRGRELEQLAAMELPSLAEGLAVDAADLDGNGRMELFLTAARQGRLHSQRVTFAGRRLMVEEEGIRWYFRTLPLPGEGEVLLAQKMGDLMHDYERPVFRVALKGGRLAKGQPVDLPAKLSLFGFLPFSGAAGKTLYARLSPRDQLEVVNARGQSLWEATEPFGGTEVAFMRQDPDAPARSPDETRPVWIQMRMTRAEDGSLVVPVNEGQRLLSRTRTFKRSYLAGLKWDGFALSEAWRTRPIDGYLIDYCLADADNDGHREVVMAVSFGGKGLFAKQRSALVLVEGL